MKRSSGVQGDRRRGIRKPNAQQSLLEGAALARRAERRRLAGLSQQGGDAQGESGGDGRRAPAGDAVAWVGCQWLMDGYCGRAEEAAAVHRSPPAPQEQGNGGSDQGGSDHNGPPQRPNRAA
jgi:hypothetical protein